MPRLAAFPKCYLEDLVAGRMSLFDWIGRAATLEVEGTELYDRFFPPDDRTFWERVREALRRHRLAMPMLCYSPDFTHPDSAFRRSQIERTRRAIDLAAFLGAEICRVLSGQARPGVTREEGIRWTVQAIRELLPYAAKRNVVLAIENHYKDGFWEYPEFAQSMDRFLEIVEQIDDPYFGVNYDPSNALIAGEDPLELLDRVKHRVVSMHASDRYLVGGTIEDLRRYDGSQGYAAILHHGVIGRGLNDYDAIFATLAAVGFDGWISIEDGLNGMEELRESVAFLRAKIAEHFPPKRT